MKAKFHPDAEQYIVEAASFYAQEGAPALAARFVAEVKRVRNLLLSHPGLGTYRPNGRRFFQPKYSPMALFIECSKMASTFWLGAAIVGAQLLAFQESNSKAVARARPID